MRDLPGICIDKFPKIFKFAFTLALVEVQRLEERLRHLSRVGRMEWDTPLAHEGGGPGEFGKDEDAVLLLLASDILEGHEVHSVSGGCEEACIRDGIKGCQLGEGDGAVHV